MDTDGIAEGLEHVTGLVIRHLADRDGPGFTAASVLARLDGRAPVRLTALAAAEGVSQPSMTQLVQRLERQGLVARIADAEDRRASLVAITDAGSELFAERRQARRDQLATLLATLPPEDEATLALAMRVAVPIVRRLLDSAARQRPAAAPDVA
jgi:DNA-binding MarR family transcriptional regulator